MNRPDLYFKTTRILIDAYRNETLFQGNWETCLCANLIAANMGYTLRIFFRKKGCFGAFWKSKNGVVDDRLWRELVKPMSLLHRYHLRLKWGKQKYQQALQQLASTGYSRADLFTIILNFDYGQHPSDDTVKVKDGLKRVLQTLKKIHNVDHFDVQQTYRTQFLNEQKEVECLPEIYETVKEFYELERKNQLEILEQTGVLFGEPLPDTVAGAKKVEAKSAVVNEVFGVAGS